MNERSSFNRRCAMRGKLRGGGHKRSETPASYRKERFLRLEALEERQLLTAYAINTSTHTLTAGGNAATQINNVSVSYAGTSGNVDTWIVKGDLNLNNGDTLTGTGSNALLLKVGNNVNIASGATVNLSAVSTIPGAGGVARAAGAGGAGGSGLGGGGAGGTAGTGGSAGGGGAGNANANGNGGGNGQNGASGGNGAAARGRCRRRPGGRQFGRWSGR